MPKLQIKKVVARPAYRIVSDRLQELIVRGELAPGDPLPVETELAEQFGVNRSTVREGIRQLESDGLVRREGRKRLHVAIPDEMALAPRVTRALVMQSVTFRELWEVASELEPLAAKLAATAAEDHEIEELRANTEQMAEAVEASEPVIQLDMEFHALLAKFAKNRVLLLSREPVGMLLFRAFHEITPDLEQAASRNLDAHQKIVQSLANRDEVAAEEWMKRHLKDLMRGWLIAGHDMENRIDPGHSTIIDESS